jgi:hypothetical protein
MTVPQVFSPLVFIAFIPALPAQTYPDANDPPGRAAQVSFLQGNVSFQPGGVEDWVPATLNRPLTTGDRLWTDSGARVELLTGTVAIRLAGRTNLSFLNLTDNSTQLQLSAGVLSVRVRHLYDDETLEIDTPQAAFSLIRAGEYRFDVDEGGYTTVATSRAGELDVDSGEQSLRIGSRDQLRISQAYDRPLFDRHPAPVPDGFDNWCQDRDRREDLSQSARHMSREIPGYAELDNNGFWMDDPQYAWVWFPRVAFDWAPYRVGHWAWIEPWGWTWVDEAAWGYAPFHYGRWAFIHRAWGWIPGPVIPRPLFCPALVAWLGGPGFSIAISIGGPPVGWFPLGPREIWLPPYHHSPEYRERVNLTNTLIVNHTTIDRFDSGHYVYMNRNVAGAVTAVPRDVLMTGRAVSGAAVRVSPEALIRGEVRNFADVSPRKPALLDGRSPVASPPTGAISRSVFARAAPAPSVVPFEQRERAMQGSPGRPLDRSALDQLRQNQPPGPAPAIRQIRPITPGNSSPPLTPPGQGPAVNQPGRRVEPVERPPSRVQPGVAESPRRAPATAPAPPAAPQVAPATPRFDRRAQPSAPQPQTPAVRQPQPRFERQTQPAPAQPQQPPSRQRPSLAPAGAAPQPSQPVAPPNRGRGLEGRRAP